MKQTKIQLKQNAAPRYMTVPETADWYNLSVRTIWAWVYTHKIPVVRINGAVRIPFHLIEAMIDEATIPVGKAS